MTDLHHWRRGSGEPLLLIMGMSAHSGHWGDAFVDALAEDFDVIAFDHRGTGESPRSEGGFTLRDLADDAIGVLDALEVESAHVVGVSMGGMIAQELVLAHPDRVRTLTLGCTFTGGEGSRSTPRRTWEGLAAAMQSGDRATAFSASFDANVGEAARAEDGAYDRWLSLVERRPVAVQVIVQQVQAIGQHDTSRRLGELRAPTLVVHGTDDQMVPVSNAEMIGRLVPHARVEILDGAGHMFWWEQPESSADLVRAHALAKTTS